MTTCWFSLTGVKGQVDAVAGSGEDEEGAETSISSGVAAMHEL